MHFSRFHNVFLETAGRALMVKIMLGMICAPVLEALRQKGAWVDPKVEIRLQEVQLDGHRIEFGEPLPKKESQQPAGKTLLEDFGAVEENRAGKLSQDQFETISKMLMQLDFSSSPEAVVIRKGSESFEAEIPNGGEERRLLWVDPDHQRPFPESAAKAWDLCAQVLVQDRPLPVSELDEVFLSVAANDATEPEGIAVN